MSFNPKTPVHRRGRSDAKTPLTPSGAGNSASTISPTKPAAQSQHRRLLSKPSLADVSNPFITRSGAGASRPKMQASASAGTPVGAGARSQPGSRPASPVKRATSTGPLHVTAQLAREASAGVIRKGGVESRMNVITNDYVPPPKEEKRIDVKRSRSQPSVGRAPDRFITTTRDIDDMTATLEQVHLNPSSSSPGHTARLAKATGVPLGKRVLSFHEAPPVASKDPLLASARAHASALHTRPAALPSNTGAITNKTRKIPTAPERVLDAPGILDDFYLNLLAWSAQNVLAVALGEHTYVWRAETGEVSLLAEAPPGAYVAGVQFAADGAFLGVGLGTGDIELWDVDAGTRLRTMGGRQAQVSTLSWNGHILSAGCADGSIWHHDVRIARHKVMELHGHAGEVCGLQWRADGELLASGGNDNVVNIWDARLGDVAEGARGMPKWTKRNHTAAVKAIAWCPWQPSLLASGGGTNDASINVWNSTTGARLHTLKTPAQVTSIMWSPHRKELASTHGYPTNALMVHGYPSLERVAEIRDAHDQRVLFAALGPAGDVVCTGAGDENLKFWRIWDAPPLRKKRSMIVPGEGGRTDASVLAIR